VVVSELLEPIADKAVDPRVADMKDVRDRGFEDDGAERADIALVALVETLTPPCLRMQP
jgi:hypothetical protein